MQLPLSSEAKELTAYLPQGRHLERPVNLSSSGLGLRGTHSGPNNPLVQVVECLPSKCEVLSSNPSAIKKKKKERKKERKLETRKTAKV
jgi:hypothetical protein